MPASLLPEPIKSPLGAIAAGIAMVGAIVAILVYFDVHEQVLQVLEWIDARGAWAALLFVMIMAVAVVCLVPGILLTTGAGFVFGIVEGSIYVIVGTTLGAAAAFLIARHLLGERARAFIAARDQLRLIDAEMARHDWKVVMMTRLIPFFPGKLSNYIFGLSSFSFRGFVLGSAIGFVPYSVFNVYLGSIAANLATLGQREIGRTPVEWALYGCGFVAALVAVLYLNHIARRALQGRPGDEAVGEKAA